uniref:Ig-like domain-containing protein n=1 Tax=Panagrolaimus sp. ES5 TaxID=591445 RepID=A0AC34FCY0_9BILA
MDDGVTANFTESNVPLAEAGKWKCVLSTSEGQATGFIDVYLRPIVYSRQSIRVDHHDTAPFHFSASGITILKGETAELTCPVKAHPHPKVQWRVDGNRITHSKHYQIVNETTLVIKNVTYDHEKTFTCIAENEYIDPTTKKNSKYELFLERKVRVKSPIGWLWPLLLIIAILIALGVVISICECHKRNKERKM